MLEMHLEEILPAHSRFSRSWQLEHVKDEIQLPGLISKIKIRFVGRAGGKT